MNHPKSRFGDYELHYVQVPFDDRYVLVKRKKKVLMKISASYTGAFNMGTYTFINMTKATKKQFDYFVERCSYYNDELDFEQVAQNVMQK